LSKQCEFCGKFFVPDPRVGDRQRACSRSPCKKARKQSAQCRWVDGNPGYFCGRYPELKERRHKQLSPDLAMIQDKIPPTKPVFKLVCWLPVTRLSMIQDEMTLRRLAVVSLQPLVSPGEEDIHFLWGYFSKIYPQKPWI